jgi:electron transfer flavoprotein beta subunit
VDASGGKVALVKEYAGGVRGEFEVPLPAVLGIQAAEKPPRYVPVARVRAAMKSQKIESVPSAGGVATAAVEVLRLAKPVMTEHAEMLEGTPEEVAGKVREVLAGRGLL